jgi:hypothetical protein
MIVAVALAGTTAVVSYLTSASAESAGCAGRDILLGYRRADFFTLSLLSAISLVPLAMGRKSQKVADVFANYDAPIFEFASLRITFGMLVIYSSLLVFVVCIGFMTKESIMRYLAVSHYCHSTVAG